MNHIECISSTSGKEAFSLAQQHQPDIIFTDLLMPVSTWDGYETIRQLKSHAHTNHIPVIAVTAAGIEDDAWQVGCDGFLKRPFDANQLRDMLDQFS